MAVESTSGYDDIGGDKKKSRFTIPMRYVMAAMGSIGLAIIYGFKVNASIAIVAMVNHTTGNKTSNIQDGPFKWNENIQGYILGTYFAGYFVSMIPSGQLAEKVSAKWVMNIAVLANVVASLLSPLAANFHWMGFALMRFIQGLGGGASFPCMHVMVAAWSPTKERNIIASIIYAGTALGTALATIFTGVIADKMGWQAIFYVEGSVCLIWCAAWIFIADSPQEQKLFITKEEKKYILNSIGKSEHQQEDVEFPWKEVANSKPFWAIFIAHFCSNCGFYMLLTLLPSYMAKVLKFELKDNATLSALPYISMWLFTMICSNVLTIFQKKQYITMTMSRKIGTICASIVPMICLMTVSYANQFGAVVLMTIALTFIGGMYSGFLANHIDIAPNFAGTLVALTNTFATIPGVVIPIVVGKLINSVHTDEEKLFRWRMVFFTMSIFYVIEIIFYCIWGSAEEQPWNKATKDNESNQEIPLDKSNSK